MSHDDAQRGCLAYAVVPTYHRPRRFLINPFKNGEECEADESALRSTTGEDSTASPVAAYRQAGSLVRFTLKEKTCLRPSGRVTVT